MWPHLAEAGAHGAVPPQLDPALLPEHAGHLPPGPGAQSVHIAPDPQLLAFLLKIKSGENKPCDEVSVAAQLIARVRAYKSL